MTRHKVFCPKCGDWTMHEYEYLRQANGATVIVTCIKCGDRIESFKQYQE